MTIWFAFCFKVAKYITVLSETQLGGLQAMQINMLPGLIFELVGNAFFVVNR